VINGGICGDTAVQGLSRLERDVVWYRPHAVILAFGLNDANLGGWLLDPDRERRMRGELRLWERVDTALRKSHVYLTLRGRARQLWRVLSGPARSAFTTEPLPVAPRVSPQGFETAQSLLVQGIREHDPDTLILMATLTPVTIAFGLDQSAAWQQRQWTLHSEYTQIVRKVAHRSGAVLLDLQTAFADAGCSGPLSGAQHDIACGTLVGGDGVHLTTAGELLIAKAAMELLLSTDLPKNVAQQRR
jgi:lysophospholipase L1-like esterase